MILAMNGAEFGEFGAVSQPVADLQTALVGLGKGIGDNTLSKIAVDGVIGPKTAAATNRALTVHLGAGQAPSNLRTGALSQSVIVSQAAAITSLIEAEIRRRGFTVPTAKKVYAKAAAPKKAAATAEMVTYTPPAAAAAAVPAGPVYRVPTSAPGAGMDMNAIIKWSAIGFGAVAVLGIAYYIVTKKSEFAMAGLGSVAHRNDHERAQWVENDKGLSNWYKSQSFPLRQFVKKNRMEIDAAINRVLKREP
jgi:hypothetical protein